MHYPNLILTHQFCSHANFKYAFSQKYISLEIPVFCFSLLNSVEIFKMCSFNANFVFTGYIIYLCYIYIYRCLVSNKYILWNIVSNMLLLKRVRIFQFFKLKSKINHQVMYLLKNFIFFLSYIATISLYEACKFIWTSCSSYSLRVFIRLFSSLKHYTRR